MESYDRACILKQFPFTIVLKSAFGCCSGGVRIVNKNCHNKVVIICTSYINAESTCAGQKMLYVYVLSEKQIHIYYIHFSHIKRTYPVNSFCEEQTFSLKNTSGIANKPVKKHVPPVSSSNVHGQVIAFGQTLAFPFCR